MPDSLMGVLARFREEVEFWGRLSPFLFAGCLVSAFLFVLCGAAIFFNWGSWQIGFLVGSSTFLILFVVFAVGSLLSYRLENLEILFTKTEEGEL